MRTFNICFFISVLLIQSVLASEIQPRKSICDSTEMDRIAREVVQDSQMHLSNGPKTANDEGESWRQRHPIAFGSLVGFGVGFGYCVFLATGGDLNFPYAVLLLGGLGAGIGALIGSFF
jgi:hypothetical protein